VYYIERNYISFILLSCYRFVTPAEDVVTAEKKAS